MKKFILSLLSVAALFQAKAQTIATEQIAGAYCQNSGLYVVTFSTTVTTFAADNVFTLQLSDASGNFNNPDSIGSGTYAGYIFFNMPANVIPGTGYRFRVVSSDPYIIGSDNGNNLTIYPAPPAPTIVLNGNGCANFDSITISVPNNATGISWISTQPYFEYVAENSIYQNVIVAGGNGIGYGLNQFNLPSGVFIDTAGNIYASDLNNARVMKFPPNSTQFTNGIIVAGSDDSGSAANQLNGPTNLYVDANGNIYVTDANNNRVQKFPAGSTSATDGITVAGGNGAGSAPNQLISPDGVFVDSAGNMYVADFGNNRILLFPPGSTSATFGTVVAGGNGAGSGATQLNGPSALYVDIENNLYVVDYYNYRVQKYPPGSSSSTLAVTVAGSGFGNAQNQLNSAQGVFVDTAGNIYVADQGNARVLKFPPSSNAYTNGVTVATNVAPGEVFLDKAGNIYVPDLNTNAVVHCTTQPLTTSYIPTAGGDYTAVYFSPEGCASFNADTVFVKASYPTVTLNYALPACNGVIDSFFATTLNTGNNPAFQWFVNNTLVSSTDSLFLSTTLKNNDVVTVIVTGSTSCVANGSDTASETVAIYPSPPRPTISASGKGCAGTDSLTISATSPFEVTWYNNNIGADSSVHAYTLAGNNLLGGPAPNQLSYPYCVFVDAAGNIYVADYGNARIQKFPAGSTATTAGTTVAAKGLTSPTGVFVDAAGNIFVTDEITNRVLRYPAGSDSTTIAFIVAGKDAAGGTAANELSSPWGLCVDGDGNIYVSDFGNYRIQVFQATSDSATDGITVAGGNGAGALDNQLSGPSGVCLDGSGNLYVADFYNFRVQKFPAGSTPATGGVTVATSQSELVSVFVDNAGYLYCADIYNNNIQKYPPNSNSTTPGTTIAGNAFGLDGYDQASLYLPTSACVDAAGNVYVADYGNNRIQKWIPAAPYKSYTAPIGGTYTATYQSNQGCVSPPSNAITIMSVNPAPVITQTGADTLSTGTYTSYQWFMNGTLLTTDTASSIVAPGFGNFQVLVTDNAGCSDTSATVDLVSGITSIANQHNLRLYPDPNNGSFIIESENNIGKQFNIYDLTGRLIAQQVITSEVQNISLDNIAAGTYLLQIKGNNNAVIRFAVN